MTSLAATHAKTGVCHAEARRKGPFEQPSYVDELVSSSVQRTPVWTGLQLSLRPNSHCTDGASAGFPAIQVPVIPANPGLRVDTNFVLTELAHPSGIV